MFVIAFVSVWALNCKYTKFFPNVKTKIRDYGEVEVRKCGDILVFIALGYVSCLTSASGQCPQSLF